MNDDGAGLNVITPEEYEQRLLDWLRGPHAGTDAMPVDWAWRVLNLLTSLDRRVAELEASVHVHRPNA